MLFKRKPTRRLERKLQRQGYRLIAGLDEVGRGAWAGPLVAAAVVLPEQTKFNNLRDSKQLSSRQREKFYTHITNQALGYGLGIVSSQIVDKLGLQQANARAFRLALSKLGLEIDYALIDGKTKFKLPIEHTYVIHGDAKETSIAAASIIAKVTRDRLMYRMAVIYPQYGFESHVGYGTQVHYRALKDYGATIEHRHSFAPIKNLKQ